MLFVILVISDLEFNLLQGKILNVDDSFAILSICDGVKGILYDGENFYEIQNENGADHYLVP
jgi:hypothetical protein